MKTYLLTPRDPLIFRDGRPFGASERAHSLSDMPPSVLAGVVRTLAGSRDGRFTMEHDLPTLLGLGVRGPVLVQVEDGVAGEWLLPAPLDAEPSREGAYRHMALLDAGSRTDLDRLLLGPQRAVKVDAAPSHWSWNVWQQWLTREYGSGDGVIVPPGSPSPRPEERVHVSVDPATGTAAGSLLFGTSARDFTHCDFQTGELTTLGLVFQTDAPLPQVPTVTRVGGEGRLARLEPSEAAWPECPEQILSHAERYGTVVAYLLTPAEFTAGYLPGWLLDGDEGLSVTLRAAATSRPLVLSGWDLALQRAKPTRRLAQAGSAYYLHLEGDPAAIRRWVAATWLRCVSDTEQARRDGFGLCVFGVWDPEAVNVLAQDDGDLWNDLDFGEEDE
ncbi:type III-B CRISPR module-associated protein Cmr3 [Deinococcus marmoris]|uniref:type III-B CRISPR module-associated protein Cmr3 n=1 Tax=Deinococcus marmoris TaxID=249408 RepID=UPI00068E537C|nr:type III-B CRISPR module-associated protein Cmr3 [Deinococcus marmoris]